MSSYSPDHMITGNAIALLVVISFIPNIYADEMGFQEPINGIFDWINEAVTGSIDETNFDNNSTSSNLKDTLDSGTDAGKQGVSLWFGIHEFFVNAIFAGTSEADLPIDRDIIVIISMLMVAGLMFGLVIHLVKENTKIALIVITLLVGLGLIGVFIEF